MAGAVEAVWLLHVWTREASFLGVFQIQTSLTPPNILRMHKDSSFSLLNEAALQRPGSQMKGRCLALSRAEASETGRAHGEKTENQDAGFEFCDSLAT